LHITLTTYIVQLVVMNQLWGCVSYVTISFHTTYIFVLETCQCLICVK